MLSEVVDVLDEVFVFYMLEGFVFFLVMFV